MHRRSQLYSTPAANDNYDGRRAVPERAYPSAHGTYYDPNYDYARGNARIAYRESDRHDTPYLSAIEQQRSGHGGRDAGYAGGHQRSLSHRAGGYYDPNYDYNTGNRYSYRQSDRHDTPHYDKHSRPASYRARDDYNDVLESRHQKQPRGVPPSRPSNSSRQAVREGVTTTEAALERARALAQQEEKRLRPSYYTKFGDYYRVNHAPVQHARVDEEGRKHVGSYTRPATTTEMAIIRTREIEALERQRNAIPPPKTSFSLGRY